MSFVGSVNLVLKIYFINQIKILHKHNKLKTVKISTSYFQFTKIILQYILISNL